MRLTLVKLIDRAGKCDFVVLNDRHYDATLNGQTDEEDLELEYMGDVYISEEVLEESGWRWKGEQP